MRQKQKVTKNIFFFCSNCFQIHKGKVSYLTSFNVDDDKINPIYNIDFERQCECGCKMYTIDDKMFDFIIRLNRLGFYTEYCCEGHWDDNENLVNSYPYIMFTNSNSEYRDEYTHYMDCETIQYLYNFLEENLNEPLEVSNFYQAIRLGTNEKVLNSKEEFEEFKKNTLNEFEKLIRLLEKENGGRNKNGKR